MAKFRSVLCVAAAIAVVLCITGVSKADVLYSEDFTGGGANTFTISNSSGGGTAGWHQTPFSNGCPASLLPGHSGPDNLRWGVFTNCTNYGPGGAIISEASTPLLDLPSDCTLGFNYLLQFQEGPTFDNADVEVSSGATLASFAGGELTNNGIWNAIGGLELPSASVTIDFIGNTPDLTLNTGAGWHIDDVVVDCPAATTPAVSGWGVFVLMMGISTAMAAALFRMRRRTEVRGL